MFPFSCPFINDDNTISFMNSMSDFKSMYVDGRIKLLKENLITLQEKNDENLKEEIQKIKDELKHLQEIKDKY